MLGIIALLLLIVFEGEVGFEIESINSARRLEAFSIIFRQSFIK